MASTATSFIPVDDLQPLVSLTQVADFYQIKLPTVKQIGNQVRSKCFLHCGKAEETGDRALAIDMEHPAKQWKCFQEGCGKQGNLVSLCDLVKPGENMGGKPRGERFKAIARDLFAMVNPEEAEPESKSQGGVEGKVTQPEQNSHPKNLNTCSLAGRHC